MSQRYIGGLIYNPPGGFSGQFGASSTDMLSAASNAAFAFGTGDFTIEAFVLATTSQTDNWIVGLHNNCWLRVGSGGALEFYNSVGSSSVIAGSAMPTNQWVHVAAVRSGTTLTIYQNGTSVASGTVSSNFSTSVACTIGNQSGFDRRWNGYISNVRVVKGTAVYTSAFTPPVGPLQAITNTSLLTCAYPTFRDGSSNNFTITVNGNTAVSTQNPFPQTQLPNPALGNQGNGVYSMSQYQALRSQNLWPAIDPYFDYVTLMLHGNGTNGAQNNTFLDSSTNNFTITRNGNTTQGTFTPYGANWGNYFDGSSILTFASSTNYVPGSGQFCLECWFFPTTTSGDRWLIGNRNGNFVPFGINYPATTYPGTLLFYISSNGSSWDVVNGTTVSGVNANQWNHFALVRNSSNQFIVYINGVGTTIATNAANFTSAQPFYVGGSPSAGDADFIGYISNTRFVKGDSVYSGNFTPSTAPLTAITNTQLLTSQSNRFIDNSSNAVTPTLTGSPSVQRFSPFNPTTPYAAGTIGGSGYFDGSGDWLSLADNAAWNMGSGDFTAEAWIYPTSFANEAMIMGQWSGDTGGTTLSWALMFSSGSTGYLRLITSSNGSSVLFDLSTSTFALTLNMWQHIAAVRSGNTYTIYVNGVSRATTTNSSALYDATNAFTIGAESNTQSQYFTGYISNLRVVKGTAVYTGAFTPPSTPVAAVSGTSLLCDFTNGGIIDNAMMNDLETVGNAQISTSVSKFGGGSLAFDGSGDALRALTTPNLIYGSGDVTIEAWVYLNTIAGSPQVIVDTRASSAGSELLNFQFQSGVLYVYAGAYSLATELIAGTSAISATTWTHVAFVRSSGTNRLFVNGTQQSSNTNAWTQVLNSGTLTSVGMVATSTGNPMNGYIDDLRITKGYARYTANFTPQRSQWQDQ